MYNSNKFREVGTIMLNKKNVDAYLRQCISQAYTAEGREYTEDELDKGFYYVVVNNSYLVYKICTPYERVNRRVNYRMHRNFKKNFGIVAMSNPVEANYEVGYSLEIYPTLEVRDKNFTRNAFTLKDGFRTTYVFLKDYALFINEEGKYIPALVYEKIAIERLGEEKFVQRLKSNENIYKEPIFYKEYVELFEKAFNSSVKLNISFCSSNLSEIHV